MNVVDGIKVVLAQMQWRLQYTRSWSITEESTKPAINFSPQLNTQGLEVFALVSCFVPMSVTQIYCYQDQPLKPAGI